MKDPLSTVRGIEQGRAWFAYKKVEEAKELLNEQEGKKYKAYVRKLPMYIKTNGLGATLAFIKSKAQSKKAHENREAGQADEGKPDDKKVYSCIYRQIGEWLKHDGKQLLPSDEEELVVAVISLQSADYRVVTGEVLAFLGWLRRFAEGLIEGEAEDED